MRKTLLIPLVAAAALTTAAPAMAQTITATGTQSVKVKPSNRQNNASIVAAVQAAQLAGISGAIADAHQLAGEYASSAGLTLGSIVSITDVITNGPFGGFSSSTFCPFGPNQYCGTVQQISVRIVKGKKKIKRGKKVRRCDVPAFETTALSVTYSAS